MRSSASLFHLWRIVDQYSSDRIVDPFELSAPDGKNKTIDPVLDYHERSKHQLDRYAPGPVGLDWNSQPDPFRRYAGALLLDLHLQNSDLPVCWDDLFDATAIPQRELNGETLAWLMQLSLGISAWKSYAGNRWALRCNPSSGNLHPTEGYLICPDLPGLEAGVYHYRPDLHGLERRATAPLMWSGGVLLALTGIHWHGGLAELALVAANVSLFVASPLIAPLAMLGWGASLGGFIGGGWNGKRDAN